MQTGSTTSAPQSAPPAELPPFLRARAETAAAPDKRMRMPRFRLLPAVICGASLLFALKVMDIAAGAADLMASPEPAKESGASAADKASLEAVAADAQALVNDAMGGGGKDTSGELTLAATDFRSRSEVGLLQDLAARRQELNERAQELDTRERLLMATEQRIDGKIERLKEIEAQIKKLLMLHDEQEAAQLNDLVRVYETMKPKEAAAILEKLELDVLLKVVQRMNNRKLALVLAQMDPEIAKKVTVEMATRRELPAFEG